MPAKLPVFFVVSFVSGTPGIGQDFLAENRQVLGAAQAGELPGYPPTTYGIFHGLIVINGDEWDGIRMIIVGDFIRNGGSTVVNRTWDMGVIISTAINSPRNQQLRPKQDHRQKGT